MAPAQQVSTLTIRIIRVLHATLTARHARAHSIPTASLAQTLVWSSRVGSVRHPAMLGTGQILLKCVKHVTRLVQIARKETQQIANHVIQASF